MSQSRSKCYWNLGLAAALTIGGSFAFCGDYALALIRSNESLKPENLDGKLVDSTIRTNDTFNPSLLDSNRQRQSSQTDEVQQTKEFAPKFPEREIKVACNYFGKCGY